MLHAACMIGAAVWAILRASRLIRTQASKFGTYFAFSNLTKFAPPHP
jgi:hypothetical protein